MSNEAMEYAKALAAELNHLDERWDATNQAVLALDREITTVRDKMMEVVKSLDGTLVIGNQVFTVEGNRLVTLQAVVAGQPQGQGYYDPATQSTVRWQQLGKVLPPDDRIVLAIPKGYRQGIPMLHNSSEQEWENWHGDRSSTSDSDLWAELPLAPKGKP